MAKFVAEKLIHKILDADEFTQIIDKIKEQNLNDFKEKGNSEDDKMVGNVLMF